jgi:hypothetical protein
MTAVTAPADTDADAEPAGGRAFAAGVRDGEFDLS